jgi:hypothetical protein
LAGPKPSPPPPRLAPPPFEQAFTTTSVPQGQVLKAGDHLAVVGPGSGNNVAVGGARVNSTGQLVIQFINPTAGSLTHASGVFFFKVSRL